MTSMMDMSYNVVCLQDWLTMEHNDKTGFLSGDILIYTDHHMLLFNVGPWFLG